MKKISLALIVSLLLFPLISFAQSSSTTIPTPPASWVAFQQQEHAKRIAFFNQLKADRDAFLSANPDAQTYVNQLRASSQARMNAWRAAHPRKASTP